MKRFRTFLFWCHLVVGLFVAVVVLIMSVTGVLLTYEKQMIYRADVADLDAGPPEAGMARLSAGELLARVEAAEGVRPVSVTWRSDPELPVAVSLGGAGTRYVNAYTGLVLGGPDEEIRAFFRSVTDWHRWLAGEDEARETGKAITGAANLGFLFIVLSGLYLWWPRNWRWNAVRAVTWFRGGLSPRARDFNWHNVIGFWSFLPLLAIVASGVVISYPWASNLVYTLNGEEPPVRRGPPGPPAGGGGSGQDVPADAPYSLKEVVFADYGVMVAPVEARMPAWKILTLNVPAAGDANVRLSLNAGTAGQPQKQAQLEIDRVTGAEASYRGFEAGTAGQKMRSILRFTHTGEVLGFWGQTLAGLVTMGTILLAYTGVTLSLRRFGAWRRRRKDAASRHGAVETQDVASRP